MEKIGVILPVWVVNEQLLQLTKDCIESLGDVYLCIIDNNSLVGGGYLRSKADLYVKNHENLGYAKAVNQGLKLISNKLIAIVNNDTRISPNWQEVAREVLQDKEIYSCHFRMTDYERPFEYGHTTHKTGKERWCTSSFFVVNTTDMRFFYDEGYLNSYEDWDMHYMVHKAGLSTAYTDRACYQHLHSTTQQLVKEREENNTKNREFFKEKWGEYAEDIFARDYPLQIGLPYSDGFNIEV